MNDRFQTVIGLEIHIELATKSKMFCHCDADYFGKPANTNTCPVCLGMPGALPVPNREAIKSVALFAKSLNFEIPEFSTFERKHYFYPDLPKGYQISQFNRPIGQNGFLEIQTKSGPKKFRFQRVHLEEDAGKSIHEDANTLIDLNRTGVSLMEIVTDPDFDNVEDVQKFLEELQTVVRYLGISQADLDKGSMRLEPNISVRDLTKVSEDKLPPYKVEVKNINSFRFVKAAIEYEVERHIKLLENDEIPVQETRGFRESSKDTYSQRIKEDAAGYRYFPEPDIPPFMLDKNFVENLTLPELPNQKLNRFCNDYKLNFDTSYQLTRTPNDADLFEKIILESKQVDKLNIEAIEQKLANLFVNKKFEFKSPKEFIDKALVELFPAQLDDSEIEPLIEEVIKENEKAIVDYKSGKETVIMFLIGQVMKKLGKKADVNVIKEKFINRLK